MSAANAGRLLIRRRGYRVGVGVRDQSLHAVLMHNGSEPIAVHTVVFGARQPNPDDFRAAITALVQPKVSRARGIAALHLAVGPMRCQMRRLEGIPPLQDDATLHLMLKENRASFFVWTAEPQVLGSIERAGVSALAWASSFDAAVIDAASAAARELGISRVFAVPVAVAVISDPAADTVQWADGGTALDIRVEGARITSVQKRRTNQATGVAGSVTDAVGAVRNWNTTCRWSSPDPWRARMRVARQAAGVCAVVLAAGAALVAPGVEDIARARADERHAKQRQGELRSAQRLEAVINARNARLRKIRAFAERRVGALEALATLSEALPDSSAIVAFHVDSLWGTASIVGLDAVAALSSLQSNSALRSLTITSPVTRDMIGTQSVERMSVRFSSTNALPTFGRREAKSTRATATDARAF